MVIMLIASVTERVAISAGHMSDLTGILLCYSDVTLAFGCGET